jgi:hypothetical protein
LLANVERGTRSTAGRAAGLFAVVAAAYVVGAELAWHHFSSGLAFGYPPSGVDVAVLLLVSRRRWPVVIAAIVASELVVDLQHHLTLAVALESALGRWSRRWPTRWSPWPARHSSAGSAEDDGRISRPAWVWPSLWWVLRCSARWWAAWSGPL